MVSYEAKRSSAVPVTSLGFHSSERPSQHGIVTRLGEWVVEELLKVFHFMLHNHPGLLFGTLTVPIRSEGRTSW